MFHALFNYSRQVSASDNQNKKKKNKNRGGAGDHHLILHDAFKANFGANRGNSRRGGKQSGKRRRFRRGAVTQHTVHSLPTTKLKKVALPSGYI